MRNKVQYSLLIKLFIVLVLLGGLYAELNYDYVGSDIRLHGNNAQKNLPKVSLSLTELKQPSVTVKPLNAYAEVLQRPLFNVFRQKTKPVDSGAEKAPPMLGAQFIQLKGISVVAGDKSALLWHEQKRKYFSLGRGQRLENWVVESIDERSVQLSNGSGRISLVVHKDSIAK